LNSLQIEFSANGGLACPEIDIQEYSRQFQIARLAEAMDSMLLVSGRGECIQCLYNTENYPDIKLDENGLCDLCAINLERLQAIEARIQSDKLKALVRQVKNSSKRSMYDCIVGISGGADSVYTAFVCKQLGLNPLLVHVDSGWNSAEAVQNIRACASRLALDIETLVLNWEEMSDVQRSFVVSGVLDIDLPFDNAMIAALYKAANKYGVRYILTGHNSRTEGIMPPNYTFFKLDKRNILAIHSMFGTKKADSLPWIGPKQFFWYEKVRGIQMLNLLDYLDYNKDEAKAVIQNVLDWKEHGAKHFENSFTKFYQAVILPEKWKIDKRVAHLSMLVCSSQLTKAAAKKQLEEQIISKQERDILKQYFEKKLNLSVYEMDKYLQNPGVSHREFPSELDTYDRYRKFYRWFKRVLKFQLFP
jgi:N-acetyl sugar amidotransferase